MKIKSLLVSNFRGYDREVKVGFKDLSVLVGKNDIGKSTLLEALDCFFNEGKGCVKIDRDDINKQRASSGEFEIMIAIEFEDLPESIVIDATNSTTLRGEHLLTTDGTLLVVKRFPNAGKERVFIRANHPTAPICKDLLQKKKEQLQRLLDENAIQCSNRNKNAEMRAAIWGSQSDLQEQTIEIEISKIDAKAIWEQIKKYMPHFSLFQSDRKNSDGDNEVQDPMKYAIKEILDDSDIRTKLDDVAEKVKERLGEVSARTLEKLREMNPDVASSLNPKIPEPA
ncbi:MAG: AAA family ATPase, partial [Opitutales bacterium]